MMDKTFNAQDAEARIYKAQLSPYEEKADCLIGEKLWRRWREQYDEW